MNRRSFLLAIALVLLIGGGGGGLLLGFVGHEPDWYSKAVQPPGADRLRLNEEFLKKTTSLISAISAEDVWDATFTDAQINSFIEEDFVKYGFKLPDDVSRPRIQIDDNKVRLGFRWGNGSWSSIISVDLGIYVPRGEPSALALELEGVYAGALPFTAQSLLERIAEAPVWQQNGIEFNWYRNPDNGHPVAVLRSPQQSAADAGEARRLADGKGHAHDSRPIGRVGPGARRRAWIGRADSLRDCP